MKDLNIKQVDMGAAHKVCLLVLVRGLTRHPRPRSRVPSGPCTAGWLLNEPVSAPEPSGLSGPRPKPLPLLSAAGHEGITRHARDLRLPAPAHSRRQPGGRGYIDDVVQANAAHNSSPPWADRAPTRRAPEKNRTHRTAVCTPPPRTTTTATTTIPALALALARLPSPAQPTTPYPLQQ